MKKMLGIVEGYYGKPWSFVQRNRVLSRISGWGYNTYVYAPKDDPYHREKWRMPYPEDTEKEIAGLARFSKKIGMDFYFTLSPGMDIRYSSKDDFHLLLKKIERFNAKGIRHFGVLFDDIPSRLVHSGDKKSFGTIQEAQNTFLIRLHDALKSLDREISLVCCPTQYNGRGDSPYIKGFCKNLPQELLVFWTGREVCSQALSGPDTQFFTKSTGHKPLYWDNYPVNDSAMKWEMHLGPYANRDAEVIEYSDGIVLNAMEYPLASLIPLKTAADFFVLKREYNPAKSWDNAVASIVPKSISKAFMSFARFNYKSCIYPYFSNPHMLHELISLMNSTSRDFEAYMKDFLWEQTASFKKLRKSRNVPIIEELSPWIKKYGIMISYIKYYLRRRDKNIVKRLASVIPRLFYGLRYTLDRHEIFQPEVLDFLLDT